MLYVVLSRLIKGKSPFYPDRNHFHHRLLKRGFSHKQTVVFILILHLSLCFTLPISLLFFT